MPLTRYRAHSTDMLSGFLATVLDAVIVIDEGGLVVAWNGAAERTFGWTAAEVIGRPIGELIVPVRYRAAHSAGLARFLATGEAHVLNQRFKISGIHKDGREFPIELSIVPTLEGDQQLFVGILRDISLRQEADDKLSISDATLRLAIEAAEIGTWDLDPTTQTLVWSDRTKAIFGISPGVHCTLQDFYAGLHPDDFDVTVAAFESALDPALKATFDVQYRAIGKEDGVVRWVAAKGRGIFDETGACVRAIGTKIDITARRNSEERLSQSEAFTRLLLDSTAEAFYAVDTEGRTTLCNQAFLGMLGFANSDLVIGRKLHEVIHHSHPDGTRYEVADCPIYRAAALGMDPVVVSDELFFRQDNSSFPVEYRAAPIFEHGILKGAICTFFDISERRRTEDQRNLLLGELDHRVKNLFALTNSIVSMSARRASSVEDMKNAVLGRVSALSQAHALARPAVASGAQSTQQTSLSALIDLVTRPHQHFDDPNGRVALDGPDILISGNATTKLSLIFHELATNAAKYGCLSTAAGKLKVSWKVVDGSLHLVWAELGGPSLDGTPRLRGFGSRLVEQSVSGQLKGTIAFDWQPNGIQVTISIPLKVLTSG